MNKDPIKDILKKVDIFKDIPTDLINHFADSLEIISYESGTTVIHKGEEGNAMFIIVDGNVKVHDGEHEVAVLEKGNFFGEFSLLDNAKRSMSVTTINEVKTIPVSRETFFNLFHSHPEVGQKIISTLTNRLRKQNESIISQLKMREAELTRLVDERTAELKIKNEEITIKSREITDNVNYARRIQTAILPDLKSISNTFPQSFILYLPKDIVSGDFFSFFTSEKNSVLIAADCTGHGVTGAFLSVIGSSLLTQIVSGKKITTPGKILDDLHEEIIKTLNQHQSESTDGMDVSVCSVDSENKILSYAGANRPLWLIRNGEMMIYQPDKMPVGGLQIVHENKFTTHEINLQRNDTFYIFTDGFADQFGGDLGKKIMTKKLKEILLSIQHINMDEQKNYLINFFNEWKKENEQVDDVLVMGIRIV